MRTTREPNVPHALVVTNSCREGSHPSSGREAVSTKNAARGLRRGLLPLVLLGNLSRRDGLLSAVQGRELRQDSQNAVWT
jgi:hypothetical protein